METSEVQLQEVGPANWPRLLTDDEVKKILQIPGNDRCADLSCPADSPAAPTWASVTFGVVLSSNAAGRHRSLGTHISRVLSLTLDKWDLADYERMLKTGNSLVNSELEYKLPEGYTKPEETAFTAEGYVEFTVALDKFVRSKYQEKAFTVGGSGKLVETAQTKSLATVGSMQFCGVVLVKVKSARDLICLDVTSQSDPYVVAELDGGSQQVRTRAIKDNANPVWDETLMLNVRNPRSDVLKLGVWDADTLSKDDSIGYCEVPLQQLLRRGSDGPVETTAAFQELTLTGGDQHPCICVRCFQRKKPRGYLSVELTYQPLQ